MLSIVPVKEIPIAQDVPTDDLMEVYKICLQMENVCMGNEGIGLNAVQVGVPWKLFIVRRPSESFEYYLNTEYEPVGDEQALGVEGCLSIRNKDGSNRFFEVSRFKKVRIKGHQLGVKPLTGALHIQSVDFILDDSLYSVVFQHEVDHSLGILISSKGKEIEFR